MRRKTIFWICDVIFMNIYDVYRINNFPRYFGYPSQIVVRDIDELKRQMLIHQNKDPLYVSHNSHNREHVIYAQMFFDFDAHSRSVEDMEKAQKDCQKFVDYHRNKTDILINFTGGGFHVLLKFRPETVSMRDISPKIRGYQRYVRDNLDLQTIDLKVAEPGRLFRIPLSPYVYNDMGVNVTTRRFDIPIDENILFNFDISDILYLSEKREYYINEQMGRSFDISYLDPYNLREEFVETEILNEDIDFYMFSEEYFRNQFTTLMNRDELLIKSLLSVHPKHTQRLIACLKLKDSGLSLNSSISFFARLSEMANWDNRDLSIQKYQIETIYEGDYKMRKGRG